MKERLFTTLLFLCAFALSATSQGTATIKSFTQTADHIPGSDRRNDLNGVPCALIKVYVVDDIDRIEGNKIGDIVNRGVEKWIYMCKGSRNMRIHFKNHLPVRVTFRDYKINGLESNRVYELYLNTPDQPQTAAPVDTKGNNLKLRVSPANATIAIWGDGYQRKTFRPQGDGSLTVFLPYGRYHYSATAKGYYDREGSVFVNDEDRWEEVSLQAQKGTLSVVCSTSDVSLYLNGIPLPKNKSANSWTGLLEPGQYRLLAQKKNHITRSEDITITANKTTYVTIEKLLTKTEQKKAEKAQKKKAAASKAEEKKQYAAQKKAESKQKTKPKQQVAEIKATKEKQRNVVFGIRAGVNLATMGLDSDISGKCSMITSFHAGLNTDVKLTDFLHLNASLLFSQKGYKYENSNHWDCDLRETTKAQFVMLPVQLSFRKGLLQVNAGPYVEYGIGGEIEYGYNDRTHDTFDYYNALNYGFVVGAGLNIGKRYYLGANYEMSISDYANRNIAISLGVNF